MTRTKGNIIVEEIKIGDIHYEFEYNCGIECEVISKPILNEDGNWIWKSRNTKSNIVIDYLVNPKYPHYAPNLYDFKAYNVKNII